MLWQIQCPAAQVLIVTSERERTWVEFFLRLTVEYIMYQVVSQYSPSVVSVSTTTTTSLVVTVSTDCFTKLTVGLVVEQQLRLYVKRFTVSDILLWVTGYCRYVINSHEHKALSTRTVKHTIIILLALQSIHGIEDQDYKITWYDVYAWYARMSLRHR